MLNDRDKEVFSRQITLPEVGEKGQEELEDTGILIVGWVGMHQAMLAVQLALDLIKESSFYFLDGRKGTVRQVEVPDAVVEEQEFEK